MANLQNLIFFNEKGIEIPMQKTYTITWEIIPNTWVANNFLSNPKGHFLYELPDNPNTPPEIQVAIDDPGQILIYPALIKCTTDQRTGETSSITVYTDKDIILLDKSNEYQRIKAYKKNRFTGQTEIETETAIEYFYNRVKITFNLLSESIEQYYPINFVFQNVTTQYVQSKDEDNRVSFTYNKITSLELATASPSDHSEYNNIILGLIDTNFVSYDALFPSIKYIGQIKQDKTSVDLVAASTIIIVEPSSTASSFSEKYKRPEFNENYELYFEFQKNSEMKFISEESIESLVWKDSHTVKNYNTEFFTDLHDGSQSIIQGDYTSSNNMNEQNRPIYFSVGFETQVEGCYQNVMAMYIKFNSDTENEQKYLLGLLTFLTEVEGEDERYRALLGNLGIPDPITYPNIFFEQDPNEEGINWQLVNNKSKELMLTYDQIFPYAGTYKALFGAINFLGYQDLIFKEWYKIKDSNNRTKYVTIQTYDLQKNESLVPKLRQTYVNFGDFERYKKLNRLTMIYHLNEIDDTTGEYLDIYFKRKDVAVNNGPTTGREAGLYKAFNPFLHFAEYNENFNEFNNFEPYSTYFDLPFTTRIYECRTIELLAKLHSVRLWLEKYILGVNCYISDICGEGIIIERMKTQGYVTQHLLQDFIAEAHVTPKIKQISEFIDSSAQITCTLNEYNTLTFEDYNEIPIQNFVRKIVDIPNLDTSVYVSNPIGALILTDELEYVLENKDTSIFSLIEFTDTSFINNPMLIQDNKILFYDDTKNITKIEKNELPMIEIQQGNLRYCHGNWDNNIKYTINIGNDDTSDEEYYYLYDNESNDNIYKGTNKIILYPYVKNINGSDSGASSNYNVDKYKLYWVYGEDNLQNSSSDNPYDSYTDTYNDLDSEMIYSGHTKWNVPMLIIRNYICGNTKDMLNGDFILEIIQGNIIFRNHKVKIDDGTCVGCNVKFGTEFDSTQQMIYGSFTYMSERTPVFIYNTLDLSTNAKQLESIDELTDDFINQYLTINKDVNVKVNRIGDYTVSVKGYNNFNNVFFNQSNRTYQVNATPVKIDKIINQEHMFNEKEFFNKNKTGVELTDEEKQILFDEIENKNPEPIAPQYWRLYDIDPVLNSSNEIIFNNISYAYDIPTIGDFIIFNNFTEKVTYVDIDDLEDKKYKLSLLDENPNKDVLVNSSTIGLCVYDNIKKEIIADICPLTVIETSILDCSKYRYDVNNSYMIIKEEDEHLYDELNDSSEYEQVTDISLYKLANLCLNSSLLDSSSYFINSIQAYVYPADELLIDVKDISVNYDTKQTIITDNKQHFIESQVIKMCFATETELHNHYTKNAIDNETSYRIISVDTSQIVNPTNIDDVHIVYKYTLDGIFDLYKLNNKMYHNKAEYEQENDNLTKLLTKDEYKIKLCPAHLRAVQYVLRVDGIGEELIYKYNFGSIYKIKVKYANKPLLFENYLDTIYSAYIIDHDPDFLKNIWINPKTIYKKDDESYEALYSYKDFPITLNKGRNVILRPDPEQQRLTNIFTTYYKTKKEIDGIQTTVIDSSVYNTPFKTVWTWQSLIIDDQDNWHAHEDLVGKQTIFKSVNNLLTVRTDLLGTQTTQMDCIDIYGNLLRNFGEGTIYVKGDGKPVVNKKEQETRNIYYKDVYIVGFKGFTELSHVISQQGETTTITNGGSTNTYGADPTSNPLKVTYKIYYNDGTIRYNEGADVHILNTKGNISKTNKLKIKIGQSKYPHKHKCGDVKGLFKIKNPHPRDLVKPEILFNTDIMQYGYSVTTSISNLIIDINDIPAEGLETLNNNIISNLIKDVSYVMFRSEGEVETVQCDNLIDANLQITSFTYIDNLKGVINYIMPNNDERKEIGLLKIEVQYQVRGIDNIINASAKIKVYQEGKYER